MDINTMGMESLIKLQDLSAPLIYMELFSAVKLVTKANLCLKIYDKRKIQKQL